MLHEFYTLKSILLRSDEFSRFINISGSLENIPEALDRLLTEVYVFDHVSLSSVSTPAKTGIAGIAGYATNLELKLPGVDFISLKLLSPSSTDLSLYYFEIIVDNGIAKMQLNNVPLILSVKQTFLKPAKFNASSKIWEPDPATSADITLTDLVSLEFSTEFALSIFKFTNTDFTIKQDFKITGPKKFFIGDSEFVLEIDELSLNTNISAFALNVGSAKLHPPPKLDIGGVPLPDILLTSGTFGAKGVSGTFKAEWPLVLENQANGIQKLIYQRGAEKHDAALFGIEGGINYIEAKFDNNNFISCIANGKIKLSFFDKYVDIVIKFDQNADVFIQLEGLGGASFVEITKEHLLRLSVSKFSLARKGNLGEITISGGLEPLLFANEGMTWPKFDVKDLTINSLGQLSIGEAWIDLKDLATLDLFGFHFELRKVGFGTENNSHLWVDLSGGIRLIEQIPMGVDIEGFRIKWPQALKLPDNFTPEHIKELVSQLGIEFKGVQLAYAVPGVMKLDGLIRFFKTPEKVGFAGDMILDLPAAGFKAEAGLMVGMNNGNTPGDPDTSPFPFFYVYFGFEAAAGIPLGQSGLALNGALGMFGINVSPDKTPDQNWYYDWYKRGPFVGAHPTNKWKDERNAFAIGVGVTITTADGFVKGTRGLLVLAIPGPILIIEGRALVLEGLKPADASEPPLRALAVFDGKEKIVQFNIEAQLELVEDVVEAYAMLEAFFDLKDLTNWHLYLGQKEPLDRRIRANVLNILKADAYLMLDMIDGDSIRARLGASVSMTPEIPDLTIELGDVEIGIEFSAHLEINADGEISLQPEQFKSKATMEASLDISALGFAFSISAYSELSVDGPSPFQVEAEVGYKLDLPWPLPDYEDSAHFEFEAPDVNIQVNSPLSQVSLFNRFSAESKSTGIMDAFDGDTMPRLIDSFSEQPIAINSPVVYPDSQPVLSFEHDMNQLAGTHFLMSPNMDGKKYNIGRLQFKPTLEKVEIYERKKSAPWTEDWKLIHSSIGSGTAGLTGAWLADGDSMSPNITTARRLQLFTTNALAGTAQTTAHNGKFFNQTLAVVNHLSNDIQFNHPDILRCPPAPAPKVLVDFNVSRDVAILPNQLYDYNGLVLDADGGFGIDQKTGCLRPGPGTLKLQFHKAVKEIVIDFCGNVTDKPTVLCGRFPTSDEIIVKVKKAKEEEIKKKKKVVPGGFTCDRKVIVKTEITGPSSILVTALGSKEFFNCLSFTNSIPGIKGITILYKDDMDAAAAASVICIDNGNTEPATDITIFKPVCFYKIVTASTLQGSIDTEALNQVPQQLRGALESIYGLVLENNGLAEKRFTNIAYYQTNTPPVYLGRYIKWSYPYHQQTNFFGNNKIVIRFNRAYIRKLFGDQQSSAKHILQFRIRDSGGRYTLIPKINIVWSEADTATRFPDEETIDSIIPLPASCSKDSVVTISKPTGFSFIPNQRYELMVHHNDAGPSLLSGENDIERNWQISGNWQLLTIEGKKAGLQRIGAGDKLIMTGKDDWSNVCINADIDFAVNSTIGFSVRQKEWKMATGSVIAFYLVKFKKKNSTTVICTLELHIKKGAEAALVTPVKAAKEFAVNATSGYVRLSAHIIANTIKVGTGESTAVEISEAELITFHTSLPSTGLYKPFKTPLQNGKAGLFSAEDAMVKFKSIQINQSDLITIPFTTGAAASIKTLFEAKQQNTAVNKAAVYEQVDAAWKTNDLANVNTQIKSFVKEELKLFKAGVDLEYGICKLTEGGVTMTSREAFEKVKAGFLNSKKLLDAAFNTMMQKLNPEVLFAPIPRLNLESKIIRSGSGMLEAIVIHAPQNLDLQQSLEGANDPFGLRGRLKIISIKINNATIATPKFVFNSDMNMLVFIPDLPVTINPGNNNQVEINAQYAQYTDASETTLLNKHHRYDRIVEVSNTPQTVKYTATFGDA